MKIDGNALTYNGARYPFSDNPVTDVKLIPTCQRTMFVQWNEADGRHLSQVKIVGVELTYIVKGV